MIFVVETNNLDAARPLILLSLLDFYYFTNKRYQGLGPGQKLLNINLGTPEKFLEFCDYLSVQTIDKDYTSMQPWVSTILDININLKCFS